MKQAILIILMFLLMMWLSTVIMPGASVFIQSLVSAAVVGLVCGYKKSQRRRQAYLTDDDKTNDHLAYSVSPISW